MVIATSATRFQVGPLVRQLGVEHLLCTELEAEDGILTGRLAGRTLWGPGKIAAVQAFAAGHGIDLAASHGYANGDEDVPFLQAVGHPHPVNPQKRLAREASARGWPVLHFKRRPRRLDPAPALRTAAMYGSLLTASGTGLTMGLLNRDRRRGVDLATSVFGDLAGAVGDIKIDVTGQQHLWSRRPAVFFINHQSALIDLVVTSRLLRDGFTFVAKKEIARVPVIGPLFRMADVAFLDRADRCQGDCGAAAGRGQVARGHVGGDLAGGHPVGDPDGRPVQEGRLPPGDAGRRAHRADRHPQRRRDHVAGRQDRAERHHRRDGAPADPHGRLDTGRPRRGRGAGPAALRRHPRGLADSAESTRQARRSSGKPPDARPWTHELTDTAWTSAAGSAGRAA